MSNNLESKLEVAKNAKLEIYDEVLTICKRWLKLFSSLHAHRHPYEINTASWCFDDEGDIVISVIKQMGDTILTYCLPNEAITDTKVFFKNLGQEVDAINLDRMRKKSEEKIEWATIEMEKLRQIIDNNNKILSELEVDNQPDS